MSGACFCVWLLTGALAAASGRNIEADDPLLEPGPAPAADVEPLLGAASTGCGIILAERENPPRLALSPGGPGGVVRTLAFRADGARLYSAGFDKAVQAWETPVGGPAVLGRPRPTPQLTLTLRWEIARGLRGTINAAAASPQGSLLAIGGYGARDSTGDIVVYDAAAAQVERALLGHRDAIVSLDYSPDGARLISVSRDGEIRLWSAADNWAGVVLRPPGGPPTTFQPARFLDAATIAAAAPIDAAGAEWRIDLYTLGQQAPTPLPVRHLRRVRAIAVHRSADGAVEWATCDQSGQILLWQGTQNPQARLLRQGREGVSLDFAPDGRLFVATNLAATAAGRQAVLEIWEPATAALLDEVETSRESPAFACRVSPDGSVAAVVGGNGAQIQYFELKSLDGRTLLRPLSNGRPPTVLAGRGATVQQVAFAAGPGYRVGYGSARGALTRGFDFVECRTMRPEERAAAQWRIAADRAGVWKVQVDPRQQEVEDVPTEWRLVRGDQPRGTITALPKIHGKFVCWCWLTDANGEPYAIAFGSRITDGVFVYGVSEGGEWPLLRYFRDHSGGVASLAVSADGKYLASGSLDQTVKIWSLEGLRDPPAAFRRATAWGATLGVQGDRLEVLAATPAGIAVQRGLVAGDRVREITVLKDGKATQIGEPAAMLNAVEELLPNEAVVLRVERRGGPLGREILLIPAWLPLLTLFQDRRGDWALWTPQGYYDASVDGDVLFGWQINRGVGAKPDFFAAQHLRDEFERPAALRRVLTTGNVRDAVRVAALAGEEREGRLAERLQTAPLVTILEPRDGDEVKGDFVKVVARIHYPDPDAAPAILGRAYANGVPGKASQDLLAGEDRTVEWLAPVVDVFTRVRVQAEVADPDRPVNAADVHIRRQAVAGGRAPRLHLFTMAVRDYQFAERLPSTFADADAVAAALTRNSRTFYEPGATVALRNAEVSRESFDRAITEWQRRLSDAAPEDLLVVFLAGHGIAQPTTGEYFFIPPQASVDNYERLGLPWRELGRLARLPCRKVFLIDTCHAGSIVRLETVKSETWKRPVRSLRDQDAMVLAATDVGQEALEFASLGHGVFTQCILDGCAGAADVKREGRVYLHELAQYVEQEVPKRTAAANRTQTPRSSPTELFELLSIPIVGLQVK